MPAEIQDHDDMPEGEEPPPRGAKTMAAVRWALVAAAGLLALFMWLSFARAQLAPHDAGGSAEAPKYHCPMHPQIVSNEPGECPICHMNLEPISGERGASMRGGLEAGTQNAGFTCPMHPEIHAAEAGRCPICKMPLEAVKVGDRTLVVGQAGQRYSIVLTNNTSHRFEAVGTVDGLDVINGKPGTFDNRGYVLLPFATLEIEGFRTSTQQVAAFRFAAVPDSYAAQTGSARNVGVIGLAFFSERGDAFVPESEVRLRETASPFPADPRFSQPPARR